MAELIYTDIAPATRGRRAKEGTTRQQKSK